MSESFILQFGEHQDGDYHVCNTCGRWTMLVSAYPTWEVDPEAFKSGEITDRDPEIPDNVDVTGELTGHWCPGCEKLTCLCFHQ